MSVFYHHTTIQFTYPLCNGYICVMVRYCLLIFTLLSYFAPSFAQNADEELAAQYYQEGEFDKAVILYKKLHKKDHESIYIYQNYLSCLLELKELDEAEKMVSKQVKRHADRPNYTVDLGYIYSLKGDEKQQHKLYDDIIEETVKKIKEEVSYPASTAELLSAAFQKRDEYSYAKKSLLDTRKALGVPSLFAQSLIDIYKSSGDYEELIDECLLVLKYNHSEIEATKANLIYLVDRNIKIDYLQERVSIYLQKFPEKQVYDDLLMWVFVQQKKFRSAYRQAVAMDKRRQTEGKYLIDLAAICLSNKEYAIAIDCYDKVQTFGEDGFFYRNAVIGSVETGYQQIMLTNSYTEDQLDALILRFVTIIKSFGQNHEIAPAKKWLSDLYIYHKHELDKGIELLEDVVKMPRLRSNLSGAYKLALGDAYLMKDEVWDATLLYGQVDKDFKEDPLGQEAKLRNAKLSYYRGDFDWAKDQLDVLKTATSQLISNNAIELSLLIKDNTGLDSSTEALNEFASAQLLLFQNRLEESLKILNMLPFKYPNHALEDEIYLTKAKIFEKQREYTKAEEYYLNVINYFGDDILADNAVYALAQLYENNLNNKQKALEMYEKLIFKYNSSLFVVDARKRYKVLKSASEKEETP